MASNKKESEAFSLLKFMYNDDDDDMEDADKDEDEDTEEKTLEEQRQASVDETAMENGEQPVFKESDTVLSNSMNEPPSNAEIAPKRSEVRPPTPEQSLSLTFMPQYEVLASDTQRLRESLTIVDYGHEEVALSPEVEEGEIVGTARVLFVEEPQNANGELQERPSSERVQISTPTIQLTPQSSALIDMSQSAANNTSKESEVEVLEGVTMPEETDKDVDPLDKFLPPTPKVKCSQELQDRINKFLSYKRLGRSFNAEVRNRKDYRNPDFLLHAVRYQDIDQIGSCFNKDVFDPHGYDESDYYDAIEADMKREMGRKEEERKKSQKVEFVSGGTQAAVLAAKKINMAVSGVSSLPSSGLQSVATAADGASHESRHSKKSKWDKVDGDRMNTLCGGQDTLSATGPHAPLLSAANAGAGYSVFAQQKRREAEEKRSIERKVDRRS